MRRAFKVSPDDGGKFEVPRRLPGFSRIVGQRGRRTGWIVPRNVRKDSSGLLDVNEFFSSGFNEPVDSLPARLQKEPNTFELLSSIRKTPLNESKESLYKNKIFGGDVFSKVQSSSPTTDASVPSSPCENPLRGISSLQKWSPETPSDSNRDKVSQVPESKPDIPTKKVLPISESILYYENLEKSIPKPRNIPLHLYKGMKSSYRKKSSIAKNTRLFKESPMNISASPLISIGKQDDYTDSLSETNIYPDLKMLSISEGKESDRFRVFIPNYSGDEDETNTQNTLSSFLGTSGSTLQLTPNSLVLNSNSLSGTHKSESLGASNSLYLMQTNSDMSTPLSALSTLVGLESTDEYKELGKEYVVISDQTSPLPMKIDDDFGVTQEISTNFSEMVSCETATQGSAGHIWEPEPPNSEVQNNMPSDDESYAENDNIKVDDNFMKLDHTFEFGNLDEVKEFNSKAEPLTPQQSTRDKKGDTPILEQIAEDVGKHDETLEISAEPELTLKYLSLIEDGVPTLKVDSPENKDVEPIPNSTFNDALCLIDDYQDAPCPEYNNTEVSHREIQPDIQLPTLEVVSTVKRKRGRPRKYPLQDGVNPPASRKPVKRRILRHPIAQIEIEEGDDYTRRSRRMRMEPLKYWEGEKVVLGRSENGFFPVPVVKKVIRTGTDGEEKARKRLYSSRNRTFSNRNIIREPQPVAVYNVITGSEDQQNIVATPEMLNPKVVAAGNYKFQKVFSEGKFFASGMLMMPRGSEKPNKNSNKSAMAFFIISGEIEVQIHKTIFILSSGSQFFVPRGNQYRLVNIGRNECKLFFCHGREVPADGITN